MSTVASRISPSSERIFGWAGALLLVAILPIKLLRFTHPGMHNPLVGVAPSIFGPAGLLFILMSSRGRLSRWSLGQVALLVLVTAITLEVVQALPRPGLLARIHYTFDPIDLIASAISTGAAYWIADLILRKREGAR